MKRTLLNICITALLLCQACDDPDCIKTARDSIKIGFYNRIDGNSLKIRINKLQIIGSDSILFTNASDIISILIPINPTQDSIAAVFDTEFGVDTLILKYTSVTKLIALDCGTETLYNGLNVKRSDFDSIRVSNPNLQLNIKEPTVINENIKVYN
jgi:hypothetical protein